jgi:hypothetical protein
MIFFACLEITAPRHQKRANLLKSGVAIEKLHFHLTSSAGLNHRKEDEQCWAVRRSHLLILGDSSTPLGGM